MCTPPNSKCSNHLFYVDFRIAEIDLPGRNHTGHYETRIDVQILVDVMLKELYTGLAREKWVGNWREKFGYWILALKH